MRIYEVDEKYSILRHKIMKDCAPFLKICERKSYIPWRGANKLLQDGYGYFTTRTDRMPRDTYRPVHDMFVEAFRNAGFVANRDNSVFVSGSRFEAGAYGSPYYTIPAGEFSFTWSPEIDDLTNNFRKLIASGKAIQVFDDNVYYEEDKITYGHYKPEDRDFVDGKLKMSDYYQKYYDGKYLATRLPYRIEDNGMSEWIKENYQDDDWQSAIASGNEIMVACKGYYMIKPETGILDALELFE